MYLNASTYVLKDECAQAILYVSGYVSLLLIFTLDLFDEQTYAAELHIFFAGLLLH